MKNHIWQKVFNRLIKNFFSKKRIALGSALVVAIIISFLFYERGNNSFSFIANNSINSEITNEEKSIPAQGWSLVKNNDEVNLITRLVAAEASGEPYEGQVAVASVMLNRVRSASFPNTIGGVIYEPHAFESVSNGLIWRVVNLKTARNAAYAALNGWDPTYGCLFFWNPYKPVSKWIWTRQIIRQIGNHVFAK